jgi:hypothetical protein
MKKKIICPLCGEEVVLNEVKYQDDLLTIDPTFIGTCRCGSLLSDDPTLLSTSGKKTKVHDDNEFVLKCNQRVVDGQIESLDD